MKTLTELLDLYRTTLLDDVVPFWQRHAFDADGGLNTCIADDGRVLSRDRWGWSQWRALWVFSKLYNRIEPRAEWLRAAEGLYRWQAEHGPLEDGHWPLLRDGDGRLLRGYESIYVDGFALYALAEWYRTTRDPAVRELALATFRATERALSKAEPPPAWPYPVPPGEIAHGISMIFSIGYHELAEATGDADVRRAADEHHRRVMNVFLRRDRGLVLERLDADGRELDPPHGTAVIPGHAIESMWMQMHVARAAGDSAVLDRAVEAIRRHLEIGWDRDHDGLLLAVDADGRAEVDWPWHDLKLWWPHTEALYATLLAHEHGGESWCLEWHERICAYSFARYPVADHGEWTQKLDRYGNPVSDVVALPVKDPFHLPRALIYCIDVLERLVSR